MIVILSSSSMGGEGIIFSGLPCGRSSSVNTYFAWRDISVGKHSRRWIIALFFL